MTRRDSAESMDKSKMATSRIRDSEDAIITEKKLRVTYANNKTRSDNILKGAGNYIAKYYRPSASCATSYLLRRFPFIEWVSGYNVKTDAVKDLIAGLTVSVHLRSRSDSTYSEPNFPFSRLELSIFLKVDDQLFWIMSN